MTIARRRPEISRFEATLVLAVIALGSLNLYQYVTSSLTISSLYQSCSEFLARLGRSAAALAVVIGNATSTLSAQIQTDSSTIAMLNSTKPSGYEVIIDSLSRQVKQDQFMMRTLFGALNETAGFPRQDMPGSFPCK